MAGQPLAGAAPLLQLCFMLIKFQCSCGSESSIAAAASAAAVQLPDSCKTICSCAAGFAEPAEALQDASQVSAASMSWAVLLCFDAAGFGFGFGFGFGAAGFGFGLGDLAVRVPPLWLLPLGPQFGGC